MFHIIGMGGGLYIGPGWKGTSGITGLVCVIPVSALFIICIGSLECSRFVWCQEGDNAVQPQVNLTKYPPETVKILHQDIF